MDTKVNVTPKDNSNSVQAEDKELDKVYLDKRTVIISLVHNYSNYRRANMKTMGLRKEVIGSSITSSKILCSNGSEIEKYFPTLLGISSNNPDFITRVKAWLNNIQFTIGNEDATLNVSFRYNKKSDYLEIKKKEDAIEQEYAKVDRANLSALKEALRHKIEELNKLESSKYQYGEPEDIEQYLIYRHCLLYREVAKDTAFINSDPTIRFYIKDEQRENDKRKKLVNDRLKANNNLAELYSDDDKFNAVYIAIVAYNRENVSEALFKDKTDRIDYVLNFVNSQPDKFNNFVNDKNITTKAFIEMLIVKGELHKSEYNQQITDAEGNHIGANMNEAVAYFNNPENADQKKVYENKLKLI